MAMSFACHPRSIFRRWMWTRRYGYWTRVSWQLRNEPFAGLTRIRNQSTRLFRRGRRIHSVYVYWPWRQIGHGLKFSRSLAGQRNFHEVHPDGERGAGSGFLGSERFLLVITNPHSGSHRGREAHKPGIGEIVGGAGFAGERILHARRGDPGSMQHDFPQHEGHDARRASADHVFHIGKIFFQHAAFVVLDSRDIAWHDADAIIGENAEGGSLLEQCHFGRAQRYRQVGWDIGSNPEPMRVLDHGSYSHTVRELKRRNVSR